MGCSKLGQSHLSTQVVQKMEGVALMSWFLSQDKRMVGGLLAEGREVLLVMGLESSMLSEAGSMLAVMVAG